MRRRSTSQSSPEHWSKDFVEHLRTVHFALLTVAVGLILLLSSKPYDSRIAAAQLADIAQIRNSLFVAPVSVGARLENYDSAIPGPVVAYSPWFSATVHNSGSHLPQVSSYKVLFHIDEPNLFLCPAGEPYGHLFPPPMTTMHEFKLIWDQLGQDVVIDEIMLIAQDGAVSDDRLTKGIGVVNSGSMSRVTIEKSLDRTDRRAGTKSIDLVADSAVNCSLSADTMDLVGEDRSYPGRMYNYRFNVAQLARNTISQQLLSARFPDLKTGSFEEAAPDLAKAVRGREEQDFATLTPQIYAEASRGDEAFDAFGVKFPSEQVTQWGILVLVSVQLYLVMYLRRLFKTLKADDPGWDVPWMAMDQSLMARIMLFVSMVMLPAGAAAIVTFQASSRVMSHQWTWHIFRLLNSLNYSAKGQLLLIFVGFSISLTLCILSWKYRPRISDPVAPAQLFE